MRKFEYWLGENETIWIGTIWVGSTEPEYKDPPNSIEPLLPVEAFPLAMMFDEAGPAFLRDSVMTLLREFPCRGVPVFLLPQFLSLIGLDLSLESNAIMNSEGQVQCLF